MRFGRRGGAGIADVGRAIAEIIPPLPAKLHEHPALQPLRAQGAMRGVRAQHAMCASGALRARRACSACIAGSSTWEGLSQFSHFGHGDAKSVELLDLPTAHHELRKCHVGMLAVLVALCRLLALPSCS